MPSPAIMGASAIQTALTKYKQAHDEKNTYRSSLSSPTPFSRKLGRGLTVHVYDEEQDLQSDVHTVNRLATSDVEIHCWSMYSNLSYAAGLSGLSDANKF